MNYYERLLITILILSVLIAFVFFIDRLSTFLEKKIARKYLSTIVISIILTVQIGLTVVISIVGKWRLLDTAFIMSLLFFAIGWITTFTRRVNENQEGTVARFVTNANYKHKYISGYTIKIDPYLLSSGIFFVVSWGISFILAYN